MSAQLSQITDSPHLVAYKEKALKDFSVAKARLQEQRVKAQADYLDPASQFVRQRAEARPIQTGFLAVFIALGFFPALTFTLFGLSVVATIGGSALVFALFTCLSIISGAAVVLLLSLAVCAATAVTVVFWATAAFAAYRLVLSISRAGTLVDGLKEFELDVRNFLEFKPRPRATEAAVRIKKDAEEQGEALVTVMLGADATANGNGKANGVKVAVEHVGEDEDVKVEGQ